MKNINFLKTGLLIGGLAMILSMAPLFGQNIASASSPSLKEVRGRKTTEIKLPIKYEKLAGKDVKIKLYTINVTTGKEMVSTHNRELDKNGKVTLRVKNLTPGMMYKFRVKIKKENGDNYSSKSDSVKGSTKIK